MPRRITLVLDSNRFLGTTVFFDSTVFLDSNRFLDTTPRVGRGGKAIRGDPIRDRVVASRMPAPECM
jgi:hypothetical protein